MDVDSVVGRWLWAWSARGSNEVRVQYGTDCGVGMARALRCCRRRRSGRMDLRRRCRLGRRGLIFGTPASLGRKAYPDERGAWAGAILRRGGEDGICGLD